jgi:hypothetical protein
MDKKTAWMERKSFELCQALPEGVHWGDPLTPEIAAALAKHPTARPDDLKPHASYALFDPVAIASQLLNQFQQLSISPIGPVTSLLVETRLAPRPLANCAQSIGDDPLHLNEIEQHCRRNTSREKYPDGGLNLFKMVGLRREGASSYMFMQLFARFTDCAERFNGNYYRCISNIGCLAQSLTPSSSFLRTALIQSHEESANDRTNRSDRLHPPGSGRVAPTVRPYRPKESHRSDCGHARHNTNKDDTCNSGNALKHGSTLPFLGRRLA